MKVTFNLSYEEIMNIAKEHFSKTHNIPLEDVEVRYNVPNDVRKNDIINIETEEDRNKVVYHMKNLIINNNIPLKSDNLSKSTT